MNKSEAQKVTRAKKFMNDMVDRKMEFAHSPPQQCRRQDDPSPPSDEDRKSLRLLRLAQQRHLSLFQHHRDFFGTLVKGFSDSTSTGVIDVSVNGMIMESSIIS
mmetsp:Transcript_37396/g.57390  ORF Transcript_37396/g.57390 Transcript_37396/m.57390 type:complete len:104 (-) Transcript_37396:143-454(-)